MLGKKLVELLYKLCDVIITNIVSNFIPNSNSNCYGKIVKRDAISFIKSMEQISNNSQTWIDFRNRIGDYRIVRISPILEYYNIIKFIKTNNGIIDFQLNGFYSYTKKELQAIIRDIKNNDYN